MVSCDVLILAHTWRKARKVILIILLLLGEHADEYRKAMVTEINQLLRQRTWDRVDRASIPNGPDGKPRKVLPGTWAFKLKRLLDGTPPEVQSQIL